jgi:BNR repeat-like domain
MQKTPNYPSIVSPKLISLAVLAAALFLAAGAPAAFAQSQSFSPPPFTTTPFHGQKGLTIAGGHIIFQPAQGFAPAKQNPGKGHGGGGGNGGGQADFGQAGAVAMTPDCFPNSANNFDASCAEASYQGEPMLAANPTLGVLLGSENDIYPGNCSLTAAPGTFGDCGNDALASTNGINWQRFKLSRVWGGHTFLVGYDGSVAVDTMGRAFVAFGVDDPSTLANGIVAVSSSDGGQTWTKTNPVVLDLGLAAFGVFEDKPWIAADDNVSSPYRDRLYAAWDRNQSCGLTCTNQILLVSHSSDQGQTWSTPVKINDGTSSQERVIYAFPAVDPNGTVHVLWQDYAQQEIFMDRSADGGDTWGTDVAVASTSVAGIVPTCNGGRGVLAAPQMAIDASGTIYVTYVDNVAHGKQVNLDVLLTKSTDGGATWSQPVRVSATSSGEQYNPAIAVDANGAIDVSYLDRRDDPNDCRTNTYLSRSTDGGATFTDTKITDVDSDFDGNPNGPGDYSGLASWAGTAYPFFADHRDANATIDSTYSGGGFEIYAAALP